MSAPTVSSPPTPRTGGGKGYNHRAALNEQYKHSLPLVPPSMLKNPPPKPVPSRLAALCSAFRSEAPSQLENPMCVGVWDPWTGSVWVRDERSINVLWTRGNFGKGSLSRSEPSWWKRRLREFEGGNTLSAEEVTALRRQERKNFKVARAKAEVARVEAQERAFLAGASSPGGTSSVAVEEVSRPKRPDNTFQRPEPAEAPVGERLGENMEHLQLCPEEVWFLAWGLGCLTVLERTSLSPIRLPELFHLLSSPLFPPPSPRTGSVLSARPSPRPDNPALVSYAVYHHYRSLGWVVKPGIKFCVDWLLYKRGIVFSHAEFALVVVPVYERPEERETSPHRHELADIERMDWAWLSTLNRVNSQVKKTLVLSYVTIPVCEGAEFCGGDPESWGRYQIREVVLRRFVPARGRD